MKSKAGLLLFSALVFFAHVDPGKGDAKLQIRFLSFFNRGHLKADGFCCDGEKRGSNCTGTCDYSLHVCLGKSEFEQCGLYDLDAGAIDVSASGDVSFLSGLPNLLPLDIVTWQASDLTDAVLVTIRMLDEDTSVEERVDTFQFFYNLDTPVRGRPLTNTDYTAMTLGGQRQIDPTSLTIDIGLMCDRFYYSDNCSVNCVPSDDCNGHYDCDATTGQRVCLRGWGGDGCNTQLSFDHGCTANQICEHGSTCVPYGNQQYYCCCSRGYSGFNCETDIDECATNPCLNGGICSQGLPGNYQCKCNDRYKGHDCEISKTCQDNPCQNQGRCNTLMAGTVETFYCSCAPGYTGDLCEVMVTTPSTTTTTTTTTPSTTTTTTTTSTTTAAVNCPQNYYGEDCSMYCYPVDDCTGHYDCDYRNGLKVCLSGWQGEYCNITTSPDPSCQCQNGGQCFKDTCCCAPGFTGYLCSTRVSLCDQNTCLNLGTCIEHTTGFQCVCLKGFTGERCEKGVVSPVCPENYYGPSCNVFCKPQQSCKAGQYTCNQLTGEKICGFGWTGPECDVRDPAAKHESECPDSVCRNGGQCVNSTCCCRPGFIGSLCHIEMLECASSPCRNGGRCQDLIGDYFCECRPGLNGKNCEAGQAVAEVTTTLAPTDPCFHVDCLNNGTCVYGKISGFVCLCEDGFTGNLCQESVNQPTSTANPTLPTCLQNYFGPNCDVFCIEKDSCSEGHYYCNRETGQKSCHNGWYGADCTFRTVSSASDPECPRDGTCLNGGMCFNGTCCCQDRFSGPYCEVEQLPCASSPCLNGVCMDLLNDYKCSCNPGFSGPVCGTIIGLETTSSHESSSTTTGSTGGIAGSSTTVNKDDTTGTTTLDQSYTTTAGKFNNASQSTANVISTSQTTANVINSSQTTANVISTSQTTANVINSSQSTANVINTSQSTTNVNSTSQTTANVISTSQKTANVISTSQTTADVDSHASTLVDFNVTQTTVSTESSSTPTAPSGLVCGSKICYNGAKCYLYSNGVYECYCIPDYTGTLCETAITTTSPTTSTTTQLTTTEVSPNSTRTSEGVVCVTKICYNGATCLKFGTGFCSCTSGFQGPQCETPVTATSETTLSSTDATTSQGSGFTTGPTQILTNTTSSSVPTDNQISTEMTSPGTGSTLTTESLVSGSTMYSNTSDQSTQTGTTSNYSGTTSSSTDIAHTTQTAGNSSMSTTEASVIDIKTSQSTSSGGVLSTESTSFFTNTSQQTSTTPPQNTSDSVFTSTGFSGSTTSPPSSTQTSDNVTSSTAGSGGVIGRGTTTGSTNTSETHTVTTQDYTATTSGFSSESTTVSVGSSSTTANTTGPFTAVSGSTLHTTVTTSPTEQTSPATNDSSSNVTRIVVIPSSGQTTEASTTGSSQQSTESSSLGTTLSQVTGSTDRNVSTSSEQTTVSSRPGSLGSTTNILYVNETSSTNSPQSRSTVTQSASSVTTAKETVSYSSSTSSSSATSFVYTSTSPPIVTSENPSSADTTQSSTSTSSLPSTGTSGPESTPVTSPGGTSGVGGMHSGEIYITGPVSRAEHALLVVILEKALNSSLSGNGCCSGANVNSQTTFIDRDGNLAQRFRFRYTSKHSNVPNWSQETRDSIFQDVDQSLQTTKPFSSVGNRVYYGPSDELRTLDYAYKFDVIGDVSEDYLDAMKTAILDVWSSTNPDCGCTFSISSVILKPYVGKYGTRLTRVHYFMAKDGQEVTPDQSLAPDQQAMATRITEDSATLPYSVYKMGGNSLNFDLHHSLLLDLRVKMADSQGLETLDILQKAWESYVVGKTRLCGLSRCDVKVGYVRPQLYYKTDGTVVSKLDYFVTVNGAVVDPDLHSGPSNELLRSANIPVCACVATPVYHVDVSGSAVWSDAKTLGDKLVGADSDGEKSSAAVIERRSFLDASGSQVTRVFLMPTDRNDQFSPPDYESANRIAEENGFRLVKGSIRQQYTVALDGTISTDDMDFLQNYIQQSWTLTNAGQIPGSEISVNITDMDYSYYSDKSNGPVTVVTYTISVATAESSLTIIDQPSHTSLQAGFHASAYTLCQCVPLKTRRLPVVGPVDLANKTELEVAMATAWRKENPENDQGLTEKTKPQLKNLKGASDDGRQASTPGGASDDGRQASTPGGAGDDSKQASTPGGASDGGRQASTPGGAGDDDRQASTPGGASDDDRQASTPGGAGDDDRQASTPGGASDGGRQASTPGGASDDGRQASTPGGASDDGRQASTPGGASDDGRQASNL
ncbi:hypothetical protein ACOMHN_044002 [Nucella lapillus]